jgi:hypothetical protein
MILTGQILTAGMITAVGVAVAGAVHSRPPWRAAGSSLAFVRIVSRPTRALAIASMVVVVACGGAATPTVRYSPGPSAPAQTFSFDQDAVGQVPAGATVFSGSWHVRQESGAPSPPNALCPTGTAEFPAVQLGDGVFTDVSVSVRLEPISGNEDQAGGVIFRVQDAGNYYIFRANALEGNVNLYRYVGAQRTDIMDGSAKVTAGAWHELRAVARGRHLQGFFDGHLVVEADDDTFKAGKVGLWTKSDSVTCFDDFAAAPA